MTEILDKIKILAGPENENLDKIPTVAGPAQ